MTSTMMEFPQITVLTYLEKPVTPDLCAHLIFQELENIKTFEIKTLSQSDLD